MKMFMLLTMYVLYKYVRFWDRWGFFYSADVFPHKRIQIMMFKGIQQNTSFQDLFLLFMFLGPITDEGMFLMFVVHCSVFMSSRLEQMMLCRCLYCLSLTASSHCRMSLMTTLQPWAGGDILDVCTTHVLRQTFSELDVCLCCSCPLDLRQMMMS